MRLLLLTITGLLIALFIQPKTIVSITFDDGLKSEYLASKILEDYGFKGTFYIPSGLIGKEFENNSIMNLTEVRELYSRGHEIGCHTLNHINLSSVNNETAINEIIECKNVLKEFNVESFAYPYGEGIQYEETVRKYYSSARLVSQGLNEEIEFNIKPLIFVHERMERIETLKEYIKKGKWVVVTIHGVTENPRELIDITPEELKEILDVIKNSGAKVMTVKEAIKQ